MVVGLTGGIASGKTTVAGMFRELGAVVINADDEGRAVVEPGQPALAELVRHFGPEYLLPDGTLDRRALGNRVFAAPADLQALNRITHPRIARRLRERLLSLARQASRRRRSEPVIVLIEAAILIEAGWDRLVDQIIVIVTQPSTQAARLMAGLGYTASQAETRVHAQLPLKQRLRFADYRVAGEGPLAETRAQVAAAWSDLRRMAPAPGVGVSRR